jgi:hypothetical protein
LLERGTLGGKSLLTAPEFIPAFLAIANQPALSLPGDWLLADDAARAVETGEAATAAESIQRAISRQRELAAASGISAEVAEVLLRAGRGSIQQFVSPWLWQRWNTKTQKGALPGAFLAF